MSGLPMGTSIRGCNHLLTDSLQLRSHRDAVGLCQRDILDSHIGVYRFRGYTAAVSQSTFSALSTADSYFIGWTHPR